MSQRKKEIILPTVTDESVEVFKTTPHRFIIFKISEDGTKITHSQISPPGATYGNCHLIHPLPPSFLSPFSKTRLCFSCFLFTFLLQTTSSP